MQGETVWSKKYLYVLRSISAVQWLKEGKGLVPTKFKTLVQELVKDEKLKNDIELLLQEKRNGAELDYGPRIISISEFIDKELSSFNKYKVGHIKSSFPIDKLDTLFFDALTEVWGIRIIN